MTAEQTIYPQIEVSLKAAGLLEYYRGLPPSHQKEYENWITTAKKAETKDKRIAKMIAMLEEKQASGRGIHA